MATKTIPANAPFSTCTLLDGEKHDDLPPPHQSPLRVTLDAPALFLVTAALVLGIHLLSPAFFDSTILLLPVAIYLRHDYANFLALGPGGTPSTFWGYLRISYFRLFAIRHPFKPPKFSFLTNGSSSPAGVLAAANLPHRAGPRPTVAGIAPQRQINQHGSTFCYLSLRITLEKLADEDPDTFCIAVSCFEKNGLALFSRHPVNVTCGGEVCHVHHSDKSLHMSLSPEDVAEVLLKGWGERHPLARDQAWPPMPVPRGFVMVYAPRDTQELKILCKIIEAAAWFSTQEGVKIKVLLNEGDSSA